MSGILWIILIGVIAIVALVIAVDVDTRRNFARHADGTPISYDEFDGMIRDFDRQRELLYGIPPGNDDEHGRIRDEIRRNRPRPKLTPWLADTFGWSVSLGIAAGIALLGGLCWLMIRPEHGLNIPKPVDRA